MPTKIFDFFSSIKLAVFVLVGLVASLAAGTFLESLYDTPTAQFIVYKSLWFHLLLTLLGVNIFCSAMSRYPWRKRHFPFLAAHVGILTLLAGSWVTERVGIDGNLRITEGETASVVEMDNASLVITDQNRVKAVPVEWIPPSRKFKPMALLSSDIPYDLTIDRFLSHADPIVSFVPFRGEAVPGRPKPPAVKLRLQGGPMQMNQEIWLWAGEPAWSHLQMGPAVFVLGEEPPKTTTAALAQRPWLFLHPEKDGAVTWVAHASSGTAKRGKFLPGRAAGQAIEPGWKGGVKITVLDFVTDAMPSTTYKDARVQYGKDAPTAALHVRAGTGGEGAEVWLGLGDRAVMHLEGREVELTYLPQRLVLPFSVKLDHFSVAHYDGTRDPSSYQSQVTVLDRGGVQKPVLISMNEPLQYSGYTLYQASYEDAEPRPVTSILSVNRDPGRPWKYAGSLIIVFGTIWLFMNRYLNNRKSAASRPKSSAPKDMAKDSLTEGA